MSLEIEARLARGGFALDVRCALPADAISVLFGPSGAGKSVLLSAIAGLKRLESGRVALNGRVLEDAGAGVRVPAHLRGIGLVFQDARLLPHLSVRGNLAFAEQRAPEGARKLSLAEAAERFEIAALLDRPVRNLSGGEKSRAALARALLSAPDYLLLDEPFAALDGPRRWRFLETLRELHRDFKLPMLVVTHHMDDAAALGAHLVALREGAVSASGPLREVVLAPEFQRRLDRRDIGVALPAAALKQKNTAADGAAWLRADHVLLATEPPKGLSARNVWPGAIRAIEREIDGAYLNWVETEAGVLIARVTGEAARELELTPGKQVWAIVKAHAV